MNESALFPKLLRIQDNEMYTVCRGYPRNVMQKNEETKSFARRRKRRIIAETTNHAVFDQYRQYRVNVYVYMYMRMFECVWMPLINQLQHI